MITLFRFVLLVWLALGLLSTSPAAHAQGAWWDSQTSDSDGIHLAQLPPEARDTLRLIRQGGPYPHAKDGTVFKNREGLLPAQPRGYYREYTVKTPGSRDRGARRIVAGRGGEYFYTQDHYRTFQRIRE